MPKVKIIRKLFSVFERCNLILTTHIEYLVGKFLILLHCQTSISSHYLHNILWLFHAEYIIWYTRDQPVDLV